MKPPTQVVAAAANVAPQRGIHCGRQASGLSFVGSAEVLVMNKELVEVRESSDPPDAEEADGRAGPDPGDEPSEVIALGQSHPVLLGELLEGSRENEARSSNQIALSQNEVGGEIMSSPAVEQGWSRRAKLVQEITKLDTLLRV
jgi:hypothetical protein